MEPFFDGGLIELALVFAVCCSLNFIFKRKILLIFYSLSVLAMPVILFFIRSGEAFIWVVTVCIFNAVFLVVLLWNKWFSSPGENLFDTKKIREKYFAKRSKTPERYDTVQK